MRLLLPSISRKLDGLMRRHCGKIIWMAADGETIDGRLYLKALRVTNFIDQCQDALSINGNIGEIGLYFGKSFILLYLSARKEEKVIGVDLFEFILHQYD